VVKLSYDPDADCAYLRIGGRTKTYESVEFNENIVIDLKRTGGVAGIELVDVTPFLSNLLHKKISRETIRNHLSATIGRENENELRLDLRIQNEHIIYPIPKSYTSPLISFAR
jgi:uncharacterized protein YuzE